jgi:hypothetical protein
MQAIKKLIERLADDYLEMRATVYYAQKGRGLYGRLVAAVWLAECYARTAVCRARGHDVEYDSWCTPDTGGDRFDCRRCGWSEKITYY